jgi:hypothetical protein
MNTLKTIKSIGFRMMLMGRCGCNSLPDIFFIDETPWGWVNGLETIATDTWMTLRRCPTCSQLFSVDVQNHGHLQVIARISDRERWQEEADSVERHKQLLMRSRGGTQAEPCMWAGCNQPRVRGVVHCLDHLYEMGARR